MLIPPYQKGKLTIPNGAQMPYVSIGEGPIPFVVIPGAGDGLSTVDEVAPSLTWFYRKRARENRILVVSRRCAIPAGYTLEQHADDMIATVEQLNWRPCILECNSAGGPIGQWIAVKRPDLLTGLILSCTFHRTTEHMRAVLQYWIKLAQERKWSQLNWSSIHYTFNKTEWRYLLLRPLLGWMGKRRTATMSAWILAMFV
jgi:pimeloyl-ACP methyl ester carboxylesterase